MSNIITLELSNDNADTKLSNGEYTVSFPPITINNGDIIQLRNAFIDTKQQTNDQIFLANDLTIDFEFCYYEIMNGKYRNIPGQPIGHGPNVNLINGDMYFAYLPQPSPPYNSGILKKTRTITVPKGLYTPESLATSLTRLLTDTDIQSLPNIPYPCVGPISSSDPGSSPAYDITNEFMLRVFSLGSTANGGGIDNTTYSNLKFCHYDAINNRLETNTYYAYYLYANIFDELTKEDHRMGPPIQIFTGARQVSLEFNRENSGLYEFTYLHSSHLDTNMNETIVIYYDDTEHKVNKLTRESGIIFTDIQPKEAHDFMSYLGFNLDKMLLKFGPRDPTTGFQPLLNFNNNNMTTENLMTIDDMFFFTTRFLPSGKDDDYDDDVLPVPGWKSSQGYSFLKQSNTTRSLSAENSYRFPNLSPYIIVELITNFNTNYVSGGDTKNFINAIVSRNYTQNSYITGYSDSGISYRHNGESIILSSITTRLLNPSTKEILNDIGEKNFILLDIIKNSS